MVSKSKSQVSSWHDPTGLHAQVTEYAESRGLKSSFIYQKLLEKFLKNPEMLYKD